MRLPAGKVLAVEELPPILAARFCWHLLPVLPRATVVR
jgi:hypothetical protein